MKNTKKNILLLLVSLVVFLTGCQLKGPVFFLSNPTDNDIKLKVDGKEYNLKAQSSEKVELKPGEHSYEFNGKKTEFIVYYNSEGGVINPLEKEHILFHMTYATEDANASNGINPNIIEIEGVTYEAPVTVAKTQIIDKNVEKWKYDLGQPFPKEVVLDKDKKLNVFTKIFTQKEFIDFNEKETDNAGFHEANKIPGQELKLTFGTLGRRMDENRSFEKEKFTVPDYKTPGMKEAAQKIIDLDEEYGNAVKASEQKKIYDKYKKAWKEYVQLGLKEENREIHLKYDLNLPPLYVRYLGRGVIVKY